MTTNDLFFISKNIITRKQILQVTNMRYDARPMFIFYPQPNRSVWYPKGINEFISQWFFTFSPKHLVILLLINTGEGMSSEVKSIPFKFSLQWRILFASFRFENLIVARLDPLLDNQWQSSIFEESISTSSFLKIFNAVSSKSFWSVLSGIALICRHSRLEYCELFQHWRSKETICSFRLAKQQ